MGEPSVLDHVLQALAKLKPAPGLEIGIRASPEGEDWRTARALLKVSVSPLPPIQPRVCQTAQTRLYIGQAIAITVDLPQGGFLTLFNGCTTGRCQRIYPRRPGENNCLPPGKHRIDGRNSPWVLRGPSRARTGGLEYFLGILQAGPDALLPGDLYAPLGAAAQGGRQMPYLASLPKDAWDYGIVIAEVRHPHGELAEPHSTCNEGAKS